jgi:hypothetical protein
MPVRKFGVYALAISLGLIGCGCSELVSRMDFGRPAQTANSDEQAENICRSRGLTPQYYGYQECKEQLVAERASAEAASRQERENVGSGSSQ